MSIATTPSADPPAQTHAEPEIERLLGAYDSAAVGGTSAQWHAARNAILAAFAAARQTTSVETITLEQGMELAKAAVALRDSAARQGSPAPPATEPDMAVVDSLVLEGMKIGNELQRVRAEVERLEKGEAILRELLWLRHHPDTVGLYGDDGCMDCNRCLIDFKHQTPEEIRDRLTLIGYQALAASEGSPAPAPAPATEK